MRKIILLLLLGVSPSLHAAGLPFFDNSREPLENEDFMRMTKAGYRFTPDGRVLKPGGGEPLEKAELFRVLDELESRQRLEAMLALNLIFSRDGYKDLPPDSLEEVRAIARRSWTLLSMGLRDDLKAYFSGPELEALQKGVSPVRMPRSWQPDDLGEAPPDYDPAIAAPTTLPPMGRPLSVADTMPVRPLPAPWATYPGIRPQPPAPPPAAQPPAAPPTPPQAPAPVAAAPAPPADISAILKAQAPTAEGMPRVIELPLAKPAPAPTPAPPPVATATPQVAAALPQAPAPAPAAPAPPMAAHPGQDAALSALVAAPAALPVGAGFGVAAPDASARVASQGAATQAAAPKPSAPVPVTLPPPPPPPQVRPFAEYPVPAADTFAKFLAEAPYGREAHHHFELLARHAEPEDKRIALGVVQRHLPAVLIDGSKAGLGLHGTTILPPGEVGSGKAIIVLHTGPVLAKRRRLLLASESAFVPERKEFYSSLGLAFPSLDATAEGAATAKEEEGDWGRARVFDDGSRRLKPSPEQLAGTLLAQLMLIDARARGWGDAYHSLLRARAAQFRLYRRLAAETGSAPRLDRALAAEYNEWLARPLDWSDFWVQAMAAPVSAQLAPSVTGELEERLRARGAAELSVLAKIGFAPERSSSEAAPPADEYVERERQGRIERELKALSQDGPEARAWIAAEHRFRREMTADAR